MRQGPVDEMKPTSNLPKDSLSYIHDKSLAASAVPSEVSKYVGLETRPALN
jgi:hypothetical protein